MSQIRNERTKLTAGGLNGLSIALVGAGVFAPLFGLLYGFSSLHVSVGYILLVSAACFVLACATFNSKSDPREPRIMSLLAAYVLALPFIVAAMGGAMALWSLHQDRAPHRDR